MLVLGINQDRYDSGVTLTDGQRVLYAANEERYTRQKTQGGLPCKALEIAFRSARIDARDVDKICLSGWMTPPILVRMFPSLHSMLFKPVRPGRASFVHRLVDFVQNRTPLAPHLVPLATASSLSQMLPAAVRRTLPPGLRNKQLEFVEHHRAHALSGWSLSGFEEALVITSDGMGDGLSMTVSHFSADSDKRLWSASSLNSLGIFYQLVTEAFGWIPCRHEGKLTGLAAHGDARQVHESVPFEWEGQQLRYTGPLGLKGVNWVRRQLVDCYSREDVCAWLQELLESHTLRVAQHWLEQTNLKHLVISGGVFANVKLNQRLQELPQVESLFVCPNMGDGGLSLGAACDRGNWEPSAVTDCILG